MNETQHAKKDKLPLGSLELLGRRLDFHSESDGLLYACRPDGAEVIRVTSAILSDHESVPLIGLSNLVEAATRWLLDHADHERNRDD